MNKLMENIFDPDDVWEVNPNTQTRFIDGVEFYMVKRPGTQRWLMMRKDSLKPHQKKLDSLFRK